MEQRTVNDALIAYVNDDDPEPWRKIIEAIRTGAVVVEPHANTLVLRAITRPATARFGRRLRELRATSGVGQQVLADAMSISLSAVIRHLNGQVLAQWPSVALMISTMGGDPDDFRADYLEAKAEQRANRGPRRGAN